MLDNWCMPNNISWQLPKNGYRKKSVMIGWGAIILRMKNFFFQILAIILPLYFYQECTEFIEKGVVFRFNYRIHGQKFVETKTNPEKGSKKCRITNEMVCQIRCWLWETIYWSRSLKILSKTNMTMKGNTLLTIKWPDF